MNAIKQYISVARLVLENENYDQSICREVNNILPHLEQSLTCTVCRNILREPFSPTDTVCQHHVCKNCVGGHKRLKPACSWCKDYTKYLRNTQLQCLLACYKALCNYVKHSKLLNLLNTAPAPIDTNRSVSIIVQNGIDMPVRIKTEGCDVENDNHQERYRSHLRPENLNIENNRIYENSSSGCSSNEISRIRIKQEPLRITSVDTDKSTNSIDTKLSTHSPRLRSGSDHMSSANLDKLSDSTSEELPNPKAVYSISFSGTRSKIILKRKHVGRRDSTKDRIFVSKNANRLEQGLSSLSAIRSYPYQMQQDTVSNENSRLGKIRTKPINNADRPTCRCGNATPKPGKLTCCGQRCACYMQSKACTGCRCRGCRNPHMVDGVKILGRYANDSSPEANSTMGNASSFQDLSANFFNDQISQVLPSNDLCATVSNTS